MKYKLFATVISLLSFSAFADYKPEYVFEAEPLQTVYDLKLDRTNDLEAKLHDYINNLLMSCDKKTLDNEYWRAGFFSINNYDDKLCHSLLLEPITMSCNTLGTFLMSDARRPVGLPSYYPVVKKEQLKDGVKLNGIVDCYINNEFRSQNQVMKMPVEYHFSVENPKFKTMNLRNGSYQILDNNVRMKPSMPELPLRSEIIVVVE